MHNKSKFYLLSFTWGIVMSIIGCIVALALLIVGYKPKKFGYCWRFEVGNNWGGVNLGPIIITSNSPSKHTIAHEHGHAIQNCEFGPFMIIVSVMSVCRYWYREFKYYKNDLIPPTKYDDAWYEGQASTIGTEFIDWYNNNTK